MKKETIIERFNEKFGWTKITKEAEYFDDCEYETFGRDAGCDNCVANVELREEHKDFLFDTIKEVILDLVGEEYDGQNNPMLKEYTRGYNKKRQEFLDKAREEGLI